MRSLATILLAVVLAGCAGDGWSVLPVGVSIRVTSASVECDKDLGPGLFPVLNLGKRLADAVETLQGPAWAGEYESRADIREEAKFVRDRRGNLHLVDYDVNGCVRTKDVRQWGPADAFSGRKWK